LIGCGRITATSWTSPPATTSGGALWVWERAHSRKRERQLTEAHHCLVEQDRQISVLVRLVQQNTRAMVGFERFQKHLCHIMEDVRDAIRRQ